MVLAAGLVPSRAEQQVLNFFVNGGPFYDKTGQGLGAGTGCCASYVGPATNSPRGAPETPHNSHPAITFATTSSGNGAISEASNKHLIGTKGHPLPVGAMQAGDAYDGFGGVGMLTTGGTPLFNFGGMTVTRDTEVTHGPSGAPTFITSAFTNAGVPNAARFVETITNNTGSTVSGQFGFFNNLGSDNNTLYVASNKGAPVSGTGNLWITSIQNAPCTSGSCDPVITTVLGNNKYAATQVQAQFANGNDRPAYLYSISVAPGQTVRIVLFSVLTADVNFNPNNAPNHQAAQQSDITLGGQMANLITNNGKPLPINSPFFVGLTAAEIMTIINFDFFSQFQLNGANINQTNVANAINVFLNNGGDITAISGLLGLTDGQLNATLSLLSGEAATGVQTTIFESMSAFLGLMGNPYNQGRADQIGLTPMGYAAVQKKPPTKVEQAINKAFDSPLAPIYEKRWSAWGAAYGGYAAAEGNPGIGSTSMIARTGGFAAGADYRVDPNTTIGFGLAGGTGNWSLSNGMGGGRTEDFQAGVYGWHKMGAWYASLAGAFATHDVTTHRDVSAAGVGGTFNASYFAQSVGARAESGYRYALAQFGFVPYAAIQSQALRLPGYGETSTADPTFLLNYASKTVVDTRTELGSWFDYRVVGTTQPVTLFSRVAWVHDFNRDRTATATFQTLPGATFVVNGAPAPADVALASVGARAAFGQGWTATGQFDAEVGAGWNSYGGTAKIAKAF
jgi:uncharacterized protein with beta-barrel porin domain